MGFSHIGHRIPTFRVLLFCIVLLPCLLSHGGDCNLVYDGLVCLLVCLCKVVFFALLLLLVFCEERKKKKINQNPKESGGVNYCLFGSSNIGLFCG